jgi:hypothetical protein
MEETVTKHTMTMVRATLSLMAVLAWASPTLALDTDADAEIVVDNEEHLSQDWTPALYDKGSCLRCMQNCAMMPTPPEDPFAGISCMLSCRKCPK